eukprot:COSAG02_NODE_13284_length_1415_cov_13.454425_2_plen_171_part_00
MRKNATIYRRGNTCMVACMCELVDGLIGVVVPNPTACVGTQPTTTTIAVTSGVGSRRSPRKMALHVPENLPAVLPTRGGGVRGKGSKHYRAKQQSWCAICTKYKPTVQCKVCKRPICRPGARGPSDLDVRDCWARHELHGFPAKGDKKEDWRGPWWDGYDDWHANKRAKR